MRVSAVEDLNAEGFSTLTTQANQDVDGEGNWRNNRWSVVFKRNLEALVTQNDSQFNRVVRHQWRLRSGMVIIRKETDRKQLLSGILSTTNLSKVC